MSYFLQLQNLVKLTKYHWEKQVIDKNVILEKNKTFTLIILKGLKYTTFYLEPDSWSYLVSDGELLPVQLDFCLFSHVTAAGTCVHWLSSLYS